VLADVYGADVSGNGGSWGAGISTRQGGGSGRWCSTDIKAGHAVAVPRIPANFRGGRGAPCAVAVAGGTRGGDGGGFRGPRARVGGRGGTCGDPSGRRQVGPLAELKAAAVSTRCRLCGGARRRGRGRWPEAPPAVLPLLRQERESLGGKMRRWVSQCSCDCWCLVLSSLFFCSVLFFFSLSPTSPGW